MAEDSANAGANGEPLARLRTCRRIKPTGNQLCRYRDSQRSLGGIGQQNEDARRFAQITKDIGRSDVPASNRPNVNAARLGDQKTGRN